MPPQTTEETRAQVEIRVMLPADLRDWLGTEGAKQGLTMASFVRRELIELRRAVLSHLDAA